MYIGLHVSDRYSCQILMKPKFSRQIFEKTQVKNFTKIYRLGANLFHADGRMDGEIWQS